MLKYEIARLFRLGVNPFHMRARYRRFKPEKRWVNMPGGKMIQFKFYPHKIRKRSHLRKPESTQIGQVSGLDLGLCLGN